MNPLIAAEELARDLDGVTLLDVSWELGGPPGIDGYLAGHIPGAAFVDLDRELSAPPGAGGRHPLPPAPAFESAMRRAGVSGGRPVVVYDAGSSMAAARAWWLLRYYGHPTPAVLDGGLSAWREAGLPVETGAAAGEPGDFEAVPGGLPLLDAGAAARLAGAGMLVDVRAPERYRGEHEPIDPVAGHIPGAVNLPSTELLDERGRFLDPVRLRARVAAAGVDPGPAAIGAYCGSGVAAAQAVLALELAGHPAALYVGSWSDWITDPSRPIAVGCR